MTVITTPKKPAESAGVAACWRACFHHWPANIPQRGVLVTAFDEQIPFGSFMVSEELLFIERRNPDTLGTRSVIVPYSQIAAVKIVDPLEPREFQSFGFHSVGAKASG